MTDTVETFVDEPAAATGTTLLRRLDSLPPGTWINCPGCHKAIYHAKLRHSQRVCPECGWHLRLSWAQRVEVLFDPGTFVEYDGDLSSVDPLGFVDTKPYRQRLAAARARTGRAEAAGYGTATIGGRPVVAVILDFEFMGGSMGSVVGEKVARAAELALDQRVPLVTCSSSGGARMQEGIFSLLQMAKVAAALRRLSEAGVPHFSVLVDPVYGGVSASFASLADVIIAEPGTRAGFAGPQVISQTIRQRLPEGFQTADFLLEHGHIDAVVPRAGLRGVLSRLVAFHAAQPAIQPRRPLPDTTPPAKPDPGRDPWDRVRLARHAQRPITDDYLAGIFDDVFELRGDRHSGDDPALVGGLAMLDSAPVVVIGHRKGRGTAQSVARNFGMPGPAGYRKARRLMEYAERFGLPLVMLVDTPGAYPGIDAEEANQSGAIAANLSLLAGLRTPVVAAVIGEGGSGGALAIGVADRLLMMENATLSVISPEGCATILFGDAAEAPRMARALRLTADELDAFGLVAEVVAEPAGGAHTDPQAAIRALGAALRRHLGQLVGHDPDVLVKTRIERLRSIGPVAVAAEGVHERGRHAGPDRPKRPGAAAPTR